jgi:hypothetical protein
MMRRRFTGDSDSETSVRNAGAGDAIAGGNMAATTDGLREAHGPGRLGHQTKKKKTQHTNQTKPKTQTAS